MSNKTKKKGPTRAKISFLVLIMKLIVFPILYVIALAKMIDIITKIAMTSIKFLRSVSGFIDRVIKLFKRIEIFIVSLLLYCYSLFRILNENARLSAEIYIFTIFIFILISWLWLYGFTKNPYGLLYEWKINVLFDNLCDYFEKDIKEGIASLKSKPNDIMKLAIKKEIWEATKYLNSILKWWQDLNKKVVFEQYLILLLLVVVINIIAFGFSYYAIQKIDPNSITGLNANIWECIYFATITFFNYDNGSYIIIGIKSRMLLILEMISFCYLLIVSILTFSTLTADVAEDTRKGVLFDINFKKSKLLGILRENYQLDEKDLLLYTEDDFKKEESTLKESMK